MKAKELKQLFQEKIKEIRNSKRFIVINSNLDEAHKLKTLFHELSHYLLHSSVDYSKSRKEFEAELTAILVCKKLGIDTSDIPSNTLPFSAI